MATTAVLLEDAFARVRVAVADLLDNLPTEALGYRPDDDANTIAWLVWHLTRVQDDHVAEAAGLPQLWTDAGWADRFGLPFDVSDTGYGQPTAQVGKVRAGSALLVAYYDAVHRRTVEYVRQLSDADLDRVVDESWDPPVTLGVRLVSVIADDLQHVGQASYLRGMFERR